MKHEARIRQTNRQRILAITYGRNRAKLISQDLNKLLSNEAEIIVVGNKGADLNLSGLIRIKKRKGKIRQLFEFGKFFTNSAEPFPDKEMNDAILMGIDHIQRRSVGFTWNHHNLSSVSDTKHYYHILFDMLSAYLIQKEINQIIFFNMPHLFYDTLIYQIAKSKGIKTLIISHSHFENRYFSLESVRDYGNFPLSNTINQATLYSIDPSETPSWKYMEGIKQHSSEHGNLCWRGTLQLFINLFAAETSKLLNLRFLKYSICQMRRISSELPKWRYPFLRYFHSSHLEYFDTLLKFENIEFDLNRKFVYFPLQLQPELTTSTLGGVFSDQLLAIDHLAAILPDDCSIYIKENPKQTGRMRSSIFFYRLLSIPNVKILPSYANTFELIDKSQFVATITGTVGWEAICRGKNVLTFGNCWYRNLPGVFGFHEGLRFEDIYKHKIDHQKLESQVGQLYSRTHVGDIFKTISNDSGTNQSHREAEKDSIANTILKLIQNHIDCTFPPLQE